MNYLRTLENAYVRRVYDYGYAHAKPGEGRQKALACNNCNHIFYKDDAERTVAHARAFRVAKQLAVSHEFVTGHTVAYMEIEQKQ